MSNANVIASDEGNGQTKIQDPSTRAEIEAVLRAKYEAGELDTGLIDTGVCWVVMDNVDGNLEFQWFEEMFRLDDILGK